MSPSSSVATPTRPAKKLEPCQANESFKLEPHDRAAPLSGCLPAWTRFSIWPASRSPRDAGPTRKNNASAKAASSAPKLVAGLAAARQTENPHQRLGCRLLRRPRRRRARRRPTRQRFPRRSLPRAGTHALAARDLGIRVVLIRTGIVLGEKGGPAKMLTPFQLGLGSPLGSGNQYMPWIHIDDLVELMLFAAREPSLSGPLNGTAPHPVTNREFTKTLGRVLGRPTFMPAVPPSPSRSSLANSARSCSTPSAPSPAPPSPPASPSATPNSKVLNRRVAVQTWNRAPVSAKPRRRQAVQTNASARPRPGRSCRCSRPYRRPAAASDRAAFIRARYAEDAGHAGQYDQRARSTTTPAGR